MIERYFRKPHVWRRLKEGPLSAIVPDYLHHLEGRALDKLIEPAQRRARFTPSANLLAFLDRL